MAKILFGSLAVCLLFVLFNAYPIRDSVIEYKWDNKDRQTLGQILSRRLYENVVENVYVLDEATKIIGE
jgi:hypothetical protein